MQEVDLCEPLCFPGRYQFSAMGVTGGTSITVKTEEMRTHNAVWRRFLSTEEGKKSGLKGKVAAVELRRKAPPGGALALLPPTYRELGPTQGAMIDRRLRATDGGPRGAQSKRQLLGLASPITSPPSPGSTRDPLEASTARAARHPRQTEAADG